MEWSCYEHVVYRGISVLDQRKIVSIIYRTRKEVETISAVAIKVG